MQHYGESGHDDGDHAHQFDEDVEGRAGGVLEGVSHGVAYNGGVVAGGVLAAEVAFLNELLGVVPGAAGVGKEDGQDKACSKTAGKEADNTCRAKDDTHKHRNDDGKEGREDHLVLGSLGGDAHATGVVRALFSFKDAGNLTELPAHLDDHLFRCTAHCIHCETAEEECHH